MKKLGLFFLVSCMAAVFAGCTSFKSEGLSYFPDYSNYDYMGKFDVTVRVTELFGMPGGLNLFNITADEMSDKLMSVVSREVAKRGGDGAVEIEIKYSAGLLDYIIYGLTGEVVAPAELNVSGFIVKYRNKGLSHVEMEKDTYNNIKEAVHSSLEDELCMAY